MIEHDLVIMSLVIFLPTLFALVVLCLPRGSEEAMRWVSLFGTALTLLASLFMFIDYLKLHDENRSDLRPTLLAERVAAAAGFDEQSAPQRAYDYVTRKPWIPRFGIDYYLGVDGISLPLILLTTVLSFLAMIASWNI